MSKGLSYRDAGVDIEAGDALVEAIKPFARRTLRPEVLAGIGGFGALCQIPKKYRHPVLVSGTDGVGTKLKLAFELGRHDAVGVGVVEKDRIVDGRSIAPGDVILGLASSGPHSNGYSLIRKILERAKPPRGVDLLEPTRIYVKSVLKLLESVPVKGLAHITGGGLIGNVPRILPEKTKAVIEKAAWPRPTVFEWVQREGQVAEAEMQRVFNCGIGMAVVVAAEDADAAVRILSGAGETVFRIGRVEARKGVERQAVIA